MSDNSPAAPSTMTSHFVDPGAPMPEMSRRERAGRSYEKYADQIMFLVSLLFLLAFAFMFVPDQAPVSYNTAKNALIITWLLFVVDYFIRVFLAPKPTHYVVRHPLVLLSLFIPPLRALIALRALFMLLRGTRGQRTVGAAQIAFWLVVMAILFGSLAEVYFEAGAPGAEITTYAKAVWWACVTVTTVGYGDLVPVTTDGKIVAVLLMFLGVGLISTVSATIASGLISATKKERHVGWHRSAKHAQAVLGPEGDQADQPGATDDADDDLTDQELEAIHDAAIDAEDPAIKTLGILVDAIDRLQKEVAALRAEQSVSVASGTNVTSGTTVNPDTPA